MRYSIIVAAVLLGACRARSLTALGILTLSVLSPVSVQSQTFHLSEQVTTRSLGSGTLSRPDLHPLGVIRGGADVLRPWMTVAPTDANSPRKPLSTVEKGAWIGASVGMVAGIVIWANKRCEGLDCAAKLVAFPFFMICGGAVGAAVGAGIGVVVSATPSDYRQSHSTPSMPQFRVGVFLAL